MTVWLSTLSHDTTEAESRAGKAYRVVSTFWTWARSEMHGLLEQVPRWFLMVVLSSAVLAGSFSSGLAFNLLMLREAEIKNVQIHPALQGVADLERRYEGLERRVAGLEYQIPPLSQKVDKIDGNVEKLLKRRR